MPNSFASNITPPLIRVFLEKFETQRVLSKMVDTQLLAGKFDPTTGDTVSFKRPTDFRTVRTPTGDVSGETQSDIITGKAQGVVQDYFTAFVDYDEADEAIQMDQLDELLEPLATRIVTDLEVDFAGFMMRNCGLLQGTPGTAVTTWAQIADAGALMKSTGVPKDSPWFYAVNPFTRANLAEIQRTLASGGTSGALISEAFKEATIADMFAGMRVMEATALDTYTTGTGADRAGTIAVANPDATYLTAKDTMTQSIQVTAFQANLVVTAGEQLQIVGRNRLNLSTRQPVITATGGFVVFTGTVTATVTLDGSGAGTLVVTGPALFETLGQYNTVATAPIVGDVVNLLGAATTTIQPNLFWKKQAFAIGSVPIKRLFATDSFGTTRDGLQIRVTQFSDGLANKQKVRFDLRPAFGVMNPFFAGHGHG